MQNNDSNEVWVLKIGKTKYHGDENRKQEVSSFYAAVVFKRTKKIYTQKKKGYYSLIYSEQGVKFSTNLSTNSN